MSMVGRRRWGQVAIVPNVLGLLILSAARATAQSPVIIPGLPGASLQSGARPRANRLAVLGPARRQRCDAG